MSVRWGEDQSVVYPHCALFIIQLPLPSEDHCNVLIISIRSKSTVLHGPTTSSMVLCSINNDMYFLQLRHSDALVKLCIIGKPELEVTTNSGCWAESSAECQGCGRRLDDTMVKVAEKFCRYLMAVTILLIMGRLR